jgi:multiple sugar transport system ATP-binding protein
MLMPSLELKNIIKNYGAFEALKGISFSVEQGEFVVMVGPSGCGKSTLLRSIAGLEKISSGELLISDRNVSEAEPSERGVAMVFQNYALYPHMTVAQNMGFALKISGRPKAEIDTAVRRAAEILRITPQLAKKPKALSGGQKQRVAIGRAITRSPFVFLFDEPLSNLDAALRSQMRIELGRLHAELQATMIYVTHDQTEAMTMADRIVVMNEGRVEQIGTPLELYNRPANRFVAGFLGSPRMNFLKARVQATAGRDVTVSLEDDTQSFLLNARPDLDRLPEGEAVTIGIRPEAFRSGTEDGLRFSGTAAVVENLGRESLLYLDCPELRSFDSESQDGYFAIQQSSQISGRHGDDFTFHAPPSSLFVFDRNGRTVSFPDQTTHS